MMRLLAGMVLLLIAAPLLLSGCITDSSVEELPEPGLSSNDEGTAQAVGIFTYVDLEGGFWRIAQTDRAAKAEDAPTVAVIANPGDLPEGGEAYAGAYVRATGELFDGASVRMAGQEMIVETIEVLAEAE